MCLLTCQQIKDVCAKLKIAFDNIDSALAELKKKVVFANTNKFATPSKGATSLGHHIMAYFWQKEQDQ